MTQHSTHHRHPAPRFSRVVRQIFKTLARDLFDPYRPEQHYMRGPGPKWHAKHGFSGAAKAA
jgi:hypothetical protein